MDRPGGTGPAEPTFRRASQSFPDGAWGWSTFGRVAGTGAAKPGSVKVVSGVTYEAATSKGTMTFHDSGNAWAWKWQGKSTDGGNVRGELMKSK
jgi:hypothetical protein